MASSKQFSRKQELFFTRILPLIFIVIGVVILYIGANHLRKALASRNWPTTQGKIVASDVSSRTKHGNKGRVTTVYSANIAYEFSVEGNTYITKI